MSALDAALTTVWAMEETALVQLFEIAARQNDVTPQALEAYRAQAMKNAERAKQRDGVAIINVTGALFHRANLMTEMSGATSYDLIRRDFQAALDDPKINSILFNIDSPGGSAMGTNELAEAVFQARGKKPIAAYVSGMGASAAYWLASAVDPGRLTVDPLAWLGSIGTQIALRDDSEAEAKRGVKTFRFVSSQSPLKNAEPSTDAGAAALQKTVDDMSDVFIEAVARNRGVDTETVLNDFGRGGILVGRNAVKAGLADATGSFEAVLADLASARTGRPGSGRTVNAVEMTPAATLPHSADDVAAEMISSAFGEAHLAERTRVASLQRIAVGFGATDTALKAAVADGSTVTDFALALSARPRGPLADIKMLRPDRPAVAAVPCGETVETVESLAASIAAFATAAAGYPLLS